jgi:nicotinamidase-related amidase
MTTIREIDLTADLAVERERAVLMIIDYQERLSAAIADEVNSQTRRNVCILIELARRFAIPVVVTQQYPKGLGGTVADIEEALSGLDQVHRFDKIEFSACAAADFAVVRQGLGEGRDQWIVTGMEAHVCVYQTVRALVQAGDAAHVVRDAVASRSKANWHVGVSLMERAGGIITSTEVVVFDILGRAGGDDFKAMSRLIR